MTTRRSFLAGGAALSLSLPLLSRQAAFAQDATPEASPAAVEEIRLANGRVTGVRLASGESLDAPVVISAMGAHNTAAAASTMERTTSKRRADT